MMDTDKYLFSGNCVRKYHISKPAGETTLRTHRECNSVLRNLKYKILELFWKTKTTIQEKTKTTLVSTNELAKSRESEHKLTSYKGDQPVLLCIIVKEILTLFWRKKLVFNKKTHPKCNSPRIYLYQSIAIRSYVEHSPGQASIRIYLSDDTNIELSTDILNQVEKKCKIAFQMSTCTISH